jgi:CO/xanthine dehydrogenase Mo-binding subunit
VYDAVGVWIDEIPMTPDVVVRALRAHGIGVL